MAVNIAAHDDDQARRLTLSTGSRTLAFIEYYLFGHVAVVTHTEVDAQHEGRGLGAEMARRALERFRSENRQVVPVCGFFAEQIRRRPQYLDLLTPHCRRVFGL